MTDQTMKYLTPNCPRCHKPSNIVISVKGYNDWLGGAYIQEAFPYLNTEERELIKTGFHPHCWHEVFNNEER